MSWLNEAEVETAEEREQKRVESLKQSIRSKRDKLLLETDYLIMPDYPSKPEGIEAYRQALRDITDQAGFPDNIDWPEKPE